MNDNSSIEKAVRYQVENYPASRLTDIYKSFFQDFYGPGHLLENPEAALEYLKNELKEVEGCSLKQPVEATGYKSRFARVDLCLVKEGKISYDEFSRMFIESAEAFKLPEIEEWKDEWSKITGVIENMNLQIESYDQDRKFLDDLISKGEYVVHHSDKYIEEYDPHYRIILRDKAEKINK